MKTYKTYNLYNDGPLTEDQIAFNREWIKALRSGGHKQGRNFLFNGEGYCCLGVACVVAGLVPEKSTPREYKSTAREYKFVDISAPTGKMWTLPPSVREKLGFASENGTYDENKSLSDDNDRGKSFKQIANIVESRLDKKIAEKK